MLAEYLEELNDMIPWQSLEKTEMQVPAVRAPNRKSQSPWSALGSGS